jgi:hypothetical protein
MTSLWKATGRKRREVTASSVSVTMTCDVTQWQKFSFITQSCCTGWGTDANQLPRIFQTLFSTVRSTNARRERFRALSSSGTLLISENTDGNQIQKYKHQIWTWQLCVKKNKGKVTNYSINVIYWQKGFCFSSSPTFVTSEINLLASSGYRDWNFPIRLFSRHPWYFILFVSLWLPGSVSNHYFQMF